METEKINLLELLPKVEEWAREAGAVHFAYFRKRDLEVATKYNSFDVVTRADKESEALIISRIHSAFPHHAILAEESGAEKGDSKWRWVIDPLDGTTNFSQGLPIFCVSIALEYEGDPVLGVVYAPYLDEMFTAVKGYGAKLNGNPIFCSRKTKLEECVVSTGIPVNKNETDDNNMEPLKRVGLKVRGLRRLGSAAIDLCYTAAGFLDAYWELALHRWDIAAGMLIASEAGCIVTLYRPDRPFSILSAAPDISDTMLSLIK